MLKLVAMLFGLAAAALAGCPGPAVRAALPYGQAWAREQGVEFTCDDVEVSPLFRDVAVKGLKVSGPGFEASADGVEVHGPNWRELAAGRPLGVILACRRLAFTGKVSLTGPAAEPFASLLPNGGRDIDFDKLPSAARGQGPSFTEEDIK